VGFTRLTPIADATAWIDRAVAGWVEVERLSLREARGRVLARDVAAKENSPPFDRALADGYAVEAVSTLGASTYNPLTLRLADSGGAAFPQTSAVALGSPLPTNADAVVPLDHVKEDEAGNTFEIVDSIAAGANVERAGAAFRQGTLLLRTGTRLGPGHMALLAEAGIGAVEVVRRPRVRLVITGPNLVTVGNELPRRGVFDADTPLLRGLVERDGGTADICITDRNSANAIRSAITARDADLVIVVGGSGLGKNDAMVLEGLGHPARSGGDGLSIHGIALRPGTSSGIGWVAGMPLFLLPGLPVACLWGYEMLVGRAVRRLSGRSPELPYSRREFVTARKIVSNIGFVEVWPVRCIVGTDCVEPVLAAAPDSAGGLFSTIAEADGFVLIPEASEGIASGTRTRVYLYDADRPESGEIADG
jgi:molybdopterin molybdotransferase